MYRFTRPAKTWPIHSRELSRRGGSRSRETPAEPLASQGVGRISQESFQASCIHEVENTPMIETKVGARKPLFGCRMLPNVFAALLALTATPAVAVEPEGQNRPK
jgi:hypothetical protein